MRRVNRQVILVARPTGIAQAEHFEIRTTSVPALGDGQLLVRNCFLSVEPAMRGWIADTDNYSAPVAIGAVMRALTVGEVVQSREPAFADGDVLLGWFGWQEFAVADASMVVRQVRETNLPLSLSLGVLGINGVTADLALRTIGEPRVGETVVVSTAAGAVGSAVGQIAKLMSCRTVGIAGGADKVAQCLDAFGYDAAIDYKADGFGEALAAACPDGVNVYFDNTAGAISDAVYPQLAVGARIVVCGTASISAWDPWPSGPRLERHLLVKRARAQGFVVFDHLNCWEESVDRLADWIRNGKLRYAEDVLDGIEACPDALAGLYRGENRGKRVIRL